MHVDLATTSLSVAGLAARRTFGMTSPDGTTVAQIFVGDAASVAYSAGIPLSDDHGKPAILRGSAASLRLTDGSTFVGYKLLSGTAPTAVWVDADTAVPGTASSSSGLGSVQMSVAPAAAATPIAVGANDPRVCTVEIPVQLTFADGTFVESTVWIPGVVATILSASLSSNSAIAQSNTNYLTFAVAIRDGAGGGSASVAAMVSKASGASFLAFQAVTLGAISNPTTTATSQVTFASTKTSAGQAVTGTALLRITYSVP